MRTFLVLILVSTLLVACDNDSPTASDGTPLSFETLAKASTSGFSAPERRAVRSDAEWTEVWRTLHGGQSPLPARPTVDFGRETVVLAAAGPRPNGCYDIDVTHIRLIGGGALEVEVTEVYPGPNFPCVCTQAVVHPAHAVRVPLAGAVPSFVERRFERGC